MGGSNRAVGDNGAAGEVLATYFPEHKVELRAMAEEAANSRLLGGIHYRHDNEDGLALGRQVARLVTTRRDADQVGGPALSERQSLLPTRISSLPWNTQVSAQSSDGAMPNSQDDENCEDRQAIEMTTNAR